MANSQPQQENFTIDKPSITIQKRVGCGHIWCIFVEHNNGNFDKLLVRGSMAKNTDCGETWLWSMAKILTFALRRALKESDDSLYHGVIQSIRGHTCNKSIPNREHLKSCSCALGKAVEDYVKCRRQK